MAKVIRSDWRGAGKPSFPRMFITLEELQLAEQINEAMTSEFMVELAWQDGYIRRKAFNAGKLISVLLREVQELHDLLENAPNISMHQIRDYIHK